jgi:peptide deformylase
MLLEIVKYPDPRLAKKCAEVAEVTPRLRALIEDMVETMYEKDGVGLAAPQVGHNIRLITVDDTGPKERKALRVLFNPVIVEAEGAKESEESCLSVPSFSTKIKRKETLTLKAQDDKGQDVCFKAEGLLAVILQHEIDHLNGVTIVDHAGRLKRALYDKKIAKWLKHHGKND